MRRGNSYRLANGGSIDRTQPLAFEFNGRAMRGYAGDTLASALLANGVRVVARSLKFHRPRGVFSAGVEEPNALLQVSCAGTTLPRVQATLQPLVAGLVAHSESGYPSVDIDVGRVLDMVHRLWPAGFYHKTFMWPGWQSYEGVIRRMAGRGRVPPGEDPAQYFEHNLHCEVLIVGGGAAGLAAALAAAREGVRVVLAEYEPGFAAWLPGQAIMLDGQTAQDWARAAIAELSGRPNVRLMRRTLVAGYYDHNVLTALDQSDAEHAGGRVERYWRIRARQVVLASGAIEQPLVFEHNDRPGIMLAGAVRRYLQQYGVAVGRNVLIATNNDDGYQTAFALHDAGVRVAAVVDARARAGAHERDGAQARGLRVVAGSMVARTRGSSALRAAFVRTLPGHTDRLRDAGAWIACDAIAMSAGWNPTLHLYSQAGGSIGYEPGLGCLAPHECRQDVRIVGAANAEFSWPDAVTSATSAGRAAARDAVARRPAARVASVEHRAAGNDIGAVQRRVPGGATDRQWVDFQHDVTVADLELAVRENYVSVEHLKRYTTSGMASDQGKTSNLNALAVLAELTGQPIAQAGTTTYRPQFALVTLGAIGGGAQHELYAPARTLPAHAWHVAHAAVLADYGGWKRPACYLRNVETRMQAIEREVRAVRNRLGLFEASALGKIEVRGPDAADFLNRVYVNGVTSLRPGGVRYGLMLNDNGIVIDDGVFACLGENHYLLSTTAANGERIAAWLEEWQQCEWPALDLVMLPVTSQWAVLTLAGAEARRLLQGCASDIDFSAAAFPHLSIRCGEFGGWPARVQRVSFTGELSYEIAIPADGAEALWRELMARGAAHGIEPVGIEAWLVLRLEKGFLHVGADTDGTTNALDLGFGPSIERKSAEFIGRRSLQRAHDRSPERRQLVGLAPVGEGSTLRAGAHLVTGEGTAQRSEGFVTSACVSPSLGRSIALGLLERGAARLGETVCVFDQGSLGRARVVAPAFFDPAGARMRG